MKTLPAYSTPTVSYESVYSILTRYALSLSREVDQLTAAELSSIVNDHQQAA